MNGSNALLQACGLSTGHGPCALLRDLDLTIAPGELVCLLGPNGSGKSTLLRTLAGLHAPLAGVVEIAGEPLAALTPRRRAQRMALVLPGRVRVGLLSVDALVALGRQPYTGWSGRLSAQDQEVVSEALRRVGLAEYAERDVTTLSDGEHQKALIARALAQEPRLLLLDEPTAFLDLPGRVEILALLRDLAHGEASGERAVLLSTHDLDLALRMADRLWVLTREHRLIDGTPRSLAESGELVRIFAGSEGRAGEIVAEMVAGFVR